MQLNLLERGSKKLLLEIITAVTKMRSAPGSRLELMPCRWHWNCSGLTTSTMEILAEPTFLGLPSYSPYNTTYVSIFKHAFIACFQNSLLETDSKSVTEWEMVLREWIEQNKRIKNVFGPKNILIRAGHVNRKRRRKNTFSEEEEDLWKWQTRMEKQQSGRCK